jgi:hypothetical protein
MSQLGHKETSINKRATSAHPRIPDTTMPFRHIDLPNDYPHELRCCDLIPCANGVTIL